MATTNHERVGKAMDLLRQGLSPLVDRQFKAAFRTQVQEQVIGYLCADDPIANKPIIDMDASLLLRLVWASCMEFRGHIPYPWRTARVRFVPQHRRSRVGVTSLFLVFWKGWEAGLTIRDVAKNELKRLMDEGYLQLKGERRGAYYLPSPALLERRESE